jgi:shikimate kinase
VNHLFVIGFMGSGKSTVGRLVAARLDLPFIDLDAQIVERENTDIATIFAERGEPAFRGLEHEALAGLQDVEPHVVACGGGVVVDDRNRVVLKTLGRVVYCGSPPRRPSRASDRRRDAPCSPDRIRSPRAARCSTLGSASTPRWRTSRSTPQARPRRSSRWRW